jgi:hypothetical protein
VLIGWPFGAVWAKKYAPFSSLFVEFEPTAPYFLHFKGCLAWICLVGLCFVLVLVLIVVVSTRHYVPRIIVVTPC